MCICADGPRREDRKVPEREPEAALGLFHVFEIRECARCVSTRWKRYQHLGRLLFAGIGYFQGRVKKQKRERAERQITLLSRSVGHRYVKFVIPLFDMFAIPKHYFFQVPFALCIIDLPHLSSVVWDTLIGCTQRWQIAVCAYIVHWCWSKEHCLLYSINCYEYTSPFNTWVRDTSHVYLH